MHQGSNSNNNSVDELEILRALCEKNLRSLISSNRIYDSAEAYWGRLDHELRVYKQSGYAGIILIISDYINWSRNNNVVVGPGRGSAAGSLVVYLSGITSIDPLRFGLIFERFLNPERISLPDIDTDFSDRDEVIDYLRKKYGHVRVAKVGVPSLYKPRSSIDEIAQNFALEYGESKKITKLIGDSKSFDEAFEQEPELKQYEVKYPQLFEYARKLIGFVRQITTHPSAVILTQNPIGSMIPMQRPPGELAAKGQLATGWDGEELDSLGYVKLDILTVDNLSIINKSISMINQQIDFYDLPLDDKLTLEGFEKGETIAVFQLEEQKTVGILTKLQNIRFEDIVAVNALIRPGLDISQFIESRNSGQVDYLIPELEPILSETYGVILFQEQVMRMCVDLANFSMAKADKVRKIIAKTSNQKASDGLLPIYEDFKKGYLENGLDPEKFEILWSKILACQNYIFNKSHACCYGYIAYADMFLKRKYPLQFMCAALQIRSKETYIKECERLGIKVLPPDVNKSQFDYSIEGDSIRMGLSSIKHIGDKANVLIARRPFNDEFDVVSRSKLNKNQIEALAYSGALDCFGDRAHIVSLLCKESHHDKVSYGELAKNEKEILGFYIVCNPLSKYRQQLKDCITPESKYQPMNALIGGMVSRIKEHQAKNGMMAFVNILTDDGEMDTMVWSSDWVIEKPKIIVGNIIIGVGRKTDKGNYSISKITVLGDKR